MSKGYKINHNIQINFAFLTFYQSAEPSFNYLIYQWQFLLPQPGEEWYKQRNTLWSLCQVKYSRAYSIARTSIMCPLEQQPVQQQHHITKRHTFLVENSYDYITLKPQLIPKKSRGQKQTCSHGILFTMENT